MDDYEIDPWAADWAAQVNFDGENTVEDEDEDDTDDWYQGPEDFGWAGETSLCGE